MNGAKQSMDIIIALFTGSMFYYYVGEPEPPFIPEFESVYVAIFAIGFIGVMAKVVTRLVRHLINNPED